MGWDLPNGQFITKLYQNIQVRLKQQEMQLFKGQMKINH